MKKIQTSTEFRRKPLRGAKIEDEIIHLRRKINELLEKRDREGLSPEEQGELKAYEHVEQRLVVKFDYEF